MYCTCSRSDEGAIDGIDQVREVVFCLGHVVESLLVLPFGPWGEYGSLWIIVRVKRGRYGPSRIWTVAGVELGNNVLWQESIVIGMDCGRNGPSQERTVVGVDRGIDIALLRTFQIDHVQPYGDCG